MKPATTAVVCLLVLAGCGSAAPKARPRPIPVPSHVGGAAPALLSLAALGSFTGRCPRGARTWTVRFAPLGAAATETVSWQIGDGRRHTTQLNPGAAVSFTLRPSRSDAASQPLAAEISQGTEAQSVHATVRLALASIGGGSGRCVLAGSRVDASDHSNGP